MKKILPIVLVALVSGVLAFFAGRSIGFEESINLQKYRGIDEIKADLKTKEVSLIFTLLDGTARIETRNEGSLFKSKYVKYLTGSIKNNSLLAKAKDIKVKVIFLSKTNAGIGSAEFTVYEFIEPGKSKSFEKMVSVSEDVAEFKWDIINAMAE